MNRFIVTYRSLFLRTVAGLLGLVLTLGLSSSVQAQDLSTIPGAFADLGIGAESASLGYSGTSSQRGAFAMAWNPASIRPESGLETAVSWVDHLEAVDFAHAALAVPLGKKWGWGLSAHIIGDDVLRESTIRTAWSYKFFFMTFGLGAGYRHASFGNNDLSIGDWVVFDPSEVAEGVSQQVSGSAQGFSVDAAMNMHWSDDVMVAIVARNLASPVRWKSSSNGTEESSYVESVPAELSLGAGYHITPRISTFLEWTPALKPDAVVRTGFGISIRPVEPLSLNMGRQILHDGFSNERQTWGFGLRTPSSFGLTLEAAYAYVVSELAPTQQVSLRIGL